MYLGPVNTYTQIKLQFIQHEAHHRIKPRLDTFNKTVHFITPGF